MNPALKTTPPRMIPMIGTQLSLGGNSNTSHPTQCKNGIGIHRRQKVAIPIEPVMQFAWSKKVEGDGCVTSRESVWDVATERTEGGVERGRTMEDASGVEGIWSMSSEARRASISSSTALSESGESDEGSGRAAWSLYHTSYHA